MSFESTCDGSVDVTLNNPTDHPVTFILTVEGSHPDDIRVDAGKTEVVRNEGAPKRIEVRWGKDGKFTAEGGFAQPDGWPLLDAAHKHGVEVIDETELAKLLGE